MVKNMKRSYKIFFLLGIFLLGNGCWNNEEALFRDSHLPTEQRVEDLLSRMTIEEKIGQLALVEKNSMKMKDVATYGIGGVLSGGGGKPIPNTPEAWLAMVEDFKTSTKNSRLGIPIFYGVDAVHGHSNVPGATIFPHNIGLGATRDPELLQKIGMITAQEMAATGINWNFAPTVDVAKDIRWGRTYETFGSDTTLVSDLSAAYIKGLQSPSSDHSPVIGTAKHYLGTGIMTWGSSSDENFHMDQGVVEVDEATLRKDHLPPFAAAVQARIPSIMVGHQSWKGIKMVANKYLLTDVLKNELHFTGFIVSDWHGVYEIPGGDYQALVTALEAGIDMFMLPYDYSSFVSLMKQAWKKGDIEEERLNDAVRRILRVKFSFGLFDEQEQKENRLQEIGSQEHRLVAREAVRKSLVLLKNENQTLPLPKNVPSLVIAGSAAHNLGRQSGGWTIEWQGVEGNNLPGTTILDAIKKSVTNSTQITYDAMGNFSLPEQSADIGIVVVGEKPYAEGWGDHEDPSLSNEDLETIERVKKVSKKIVIIIISGRPLDIVSAAKGWDAIIAAWLPGTEGEGVTDVLFGDFPFTGTLPIEWSL